MKKNIIILLMAILSFAQVFAQDADHIGIGTRKADASAVLELKSSNQGFLLPRLTTEQRDGISNPAVGLTIFNLETNCIESYTGEDWVGNCGTPKAMVKILNCDSDVVLAGNFKEGQSVSNTTLTLKLNVEKKGSYIISVAAKPDNGYYYNASGVFSSTGPVELVIGGMGSPKAERTASNPDKIYITMNDTESTCTKDVLVAPSAIPPMFALNAVSANGIGIVNSPLNSSTNSLTISLSGNASAFGSTYSIPAVTVNGMTFGPTSGTFSQNPMTITLTGRGTPLSGGVFPVIITSNGTLSPNSVTMNYTVASPTLRLVDFNGGGYSANSGEALALIKAAANFGTSASSLVKAQGFTVSNSGNMANTVASKPDIIVVHYPYNMNTAEANLLKGYLDAGGVVLYFTESGNTQVALNVATMMGYPSGILTNSNVTQARVERFNAVSDQIIKGPFGDLTGLGWEDDGGGGNAMKGFPAGAVVDYNTNAGGSRVFRATGPSLFFVGDGGWLNRNLLSGTTPILSANGGSNSALWGNIMAWAVNQATTSGINYKPAQ
ncbi:hypothetical protein [Flavobacterium hydatis]|nr:hypothetical protein [Flavobacterium hydatis]